MTVGVIISTYNNPRWLEKTLWGYMRQTRKPDEIVVADDGSGGETRELIRRYSDRLPLRHVWHEDRGFRKTTILNKAILASKADYLIFTDQDCVPREDFVAKHCRHARRGRFLSGGYFRLNREVSDRIGEEDIERGVPFDASRLIAMGQKRGFRMLKLTRFVEKLKEHFGDRVDVFGQGIRDFDDKWSVLAPYKYHVVIENTRTRYYWTEKLIDSFLAEAFPIYYGCTNIKDYFPGIDIPEIDIFDAPGAIKVIEKTITDGAYEKNRQALAEAKALTLLHYNIFDTIARELDKILERNPEARPEKVTVKPPVSMGNLHNAVNYTLTHNWYKWLNRKGTTLSKK